MMGIKTPENWDAWTIHDKMAWIYRKQRKIDEGVEEIG
jgi:hypothetical protein